MMTEETYKVRQMHTNILHVMLQESCHVKLQPQASVLQNVPDIKLVTICLKQEQENQQQQNTICLHQCNQLKNHQSFEPLIHIIDGYFAVHSHTRYQVSHLG